MLPDTEDFWRDNAHKSGEAIARETGEDAGNCRRALRRAKEAYPWLEWRGDPRQRRAETGSGRVWRGIAVFDLHHPSHDRTLWASILRFIEDFEPSVFIFGGDQMDMPSFNHWHREKRKYRQMEGQRIKKDYRDFQREVLDPLEAALGDDCRRVWLEGNHEKWAIDYVDEHPEVSGYFEPLENLALSEWEHYNYGESASVGKLHFMHGIYCVSHHAAKTVNVWQRNIVYGHVHTLQTHTSIAPLDTDAHSAWAIPCACNQNPEYLRGKPSAWLSGFCVFHVEENGNFSVFPVVAIGGHFIAPNGRRY